MSINFNLLRPELTRLGVNERPVTSKRKNAGILWIISICEFGFLAGLNKQAKVMKQTETVNFGSYYGILLVYVCRLPLLFSVGGKKSILRRECPGNLGCLSGHGRACADCSKAACSCFFRS